VNVVVRTGAFSQLAAEDEGVPHLLEHILFKSGSGTYAGSFDAVAYKAEAIAHNGTTGEEAVSYYVTIPSKNLEKGLKIMSDLIRTPSFDREALSAEQKVVSGELQRRAAEPQYLLHYVSSQALWGDAWRQKNPGGNLIAVMGATPDRLKGFFKQYYLPNNSALVVTGDVSFAETFTLAAKAFKSWKPGDDPFKTAVAAPVAPLAATRTGVVQAADATGLTFLVRWHGPSLATDASATYAADVFSELVNQPLSGLQRRLVDSGLFQSVSLGYQTQKHVGPIELHARTTPENLDAAAAALQEEIRRFRAPDYFTDEEVVIAKKRQQVLTAFELESASSVVHTVAALWSSAGLDYYMDYVDNVRAQTPADVRRYVGSYIAGKPMTVNVLVSPLTRRPIWAALDGILAKWSVQ
jgi:zinc protease